VPVVLAQADEDVGDQQHRDRGEEERQGRGPTDGLGVPCGLMLAAMLGAIRATERPIACQTESERRSDLPSRTGVVMGDSSRWEVTSFGV
jgi:hypothetical protein